MNAHVWLVFSVSIIASVISITVAKRLAPGLKLLDHPNGRKQHSGEVPLVGGFGVVGALFALAVVFSAGFEWDTGFWLGLLGIFVLGVLDDRFALNAKLRFSLQALIIALALLSSDLALHSLGNLLGIGALTLGVFAFPFTVFALMGVVNAFNLIDGLDGLAGGLALIAVCAFYMLGLFGVTAFAGGDSELLIALVGALVSFLFFNLRTPLRSKAAIFFGDGGSTTVGYIIGWLAISGASIEGSGVNAAPPALMLWIVAVPLLDTVVTMMRRMRWKASPFKADREHIHHLLMRAGLSVQATVSSIHLIAGAFAAFGIFSWQAGVPERIIFQLFILAFFLYFAGVKAIAYRVRIREGTLVPSR